MNKLGFYLQNSKVELPDIGDILPDTFRKVHPPVMLVQTDSINSDLLRLNRKVGGVNAFVIGRMFKTPGQQEQMLNSSDPAAEGRKFAKEILAKDPFLYQEKMVMADGSQRLLIDAWMSLNEPIPGPAWSHFQEHKDDLIKRYQAYDAFQVGFREHLQERGIEAVAFNFGAGNFTKPDHYIEHFPRTLAAYKYIGFHEYAWPHMDPQQPDPQRPGQRTISSVGLYRNCMKAIRQHPILGRNQIAIITEAGLTREHNGSRNHAQIDPRDQREETRGWLCFTEPLTQEYYFSSLQWYNNFLAEDDFVLGACLYQVGHTRSFVGHRHLGEDGQGSKLQILDWVVNPASAPSAVAFSMAMAKPARVTIRGRITASDGAVGGAVVRLIGAKQTFGKLRRAKMFGTGIDEAVIETKSGADGKYHFTKIPIGEYRLEISADGMLLFSTGFSCQGSMVVDIPLQIASEIAELHAQAATMTRRIQCGINIDPRNADGKPSVNQLKELGVGWVRFVFKQHSNEPLHQIFNLYDGFVEELHRNGIKILLVLNNESCPGWPSPAQFALESQWQRLKNEWHTNDENQRQQLQNEWKTLVSVWQNASAWQSYMATFSEHCAEIAKHFGENVDAYQIWNEPDHPGEPGYEPTCLPANYGPMLKATVRAIKNVSIAKVATAGLVSGDPSYLDRVIKAAGNLLPADVVSVHPYAKKPSADLDNKFGNTGVQSDLLQTYAAKTLGKRIWVTELGTHSNDPEVRHVFPGLALAAIDRRLPDRVPLVFWFCWSNGMVKPHGLVEKNGEKTTSFTSFQGFTRLAIGGATPVTTPAASI